MPIRKSQRQRYPRDWPKVSRFIRFERAGGRCECTGQCGTVHQASRCTARHDEPHPITGSKVVLTVAHLDHRPENCAPDNLLAMCQRCHLRYDAAEHAYNAAQTRQRKEREHAEDNGQGELFWQGGSE